MARKSSSLFKSTASKVAKKVIRGQRRKRPAMSGVLALLILLLCAGVYFYEGGSDTGTGNESAAPYNPDDFSGGIVALKPGTYPVLRAVDGDTILLDPKFLGVDKAPSVRLLGVDTPETVKPNHPVEPFGPEASAYTKSRIAANGHKVELQFDREAKDQYGRHLAYVWLGDSLLNEELIRQGLGRYLSGFPYSSEMKHRFQQAENAAKRERLGIWSKP